MINTIRRGREFFKAIAFKLSNLIVERMRRFVFLWLLINVQRICSRICSRQVPNIYRTPAVSLAAPLEGKMALGWVGVWLQVVGVGGVGGAH